MVGERATETDEESLTAFSDMEVKRQRTCRYGCAGSRRRTRAAGRPLNGLHSSIVPLDRTASSRLRAMIVGLQEQGGGQKLLTGWAKVLDLPEDDVQFGQFGLPLVAGVLSRAIEEAERADAEVGVLLRRDHIEEWRRPVFTPSGNLETTVQQMPVGPEALAYLATIASVLLRRDGLQELPEGDELAGLLDQVDDLAASVENSDLPDEVKQALLRRINDVRFAIEHVRIGGAEGVNEAVEYLIGTAIVRQSAIPNWMRGKFAAFVVALYAVFTAGGDIQQSIEAWPEMGKSLIEAVDHIDGEATEEDEEAGEQEQHQSPDEEQASAADER